MPTTGSRQTLGASRPDISTFMIDFRITTRQKYLIIISSLLLILHFFVIGLPKRVTDIINVDLVPFDTVIYALSYGYILYILQRYFDFYSLNTLKIMTRVMLFTELASCIIVILYSLDIIDLMVVKPFLTVSTLIIELLWIISLMQIKNGGYSAVTSLYKYSLAIIVTFFIGLTIALIIAFVLEIISIYNIQYIVLSIPYIFIIDFAVKLNRVDPASA